ncbi:hypothetical protein GGF42_003039 [Coemansia sp. RSA 2424]|nr:hypothetical protein GGF42_003039 [Coemansia sp. RSA 2424]
MGSRAEPASEETLAALRRLMEGVAADRKLEQLEQLEQRAKAAQAAIADSTKRMAELEAQMEALIAEYKAESQRSMALASLCEAQTKEWQAARDAAEQSLSIKASAARTAEKWEAETQQLEKEGEQQLRAAAKRAPHGGQGRPSYAQPGIIYLAEGQAESEVRPFLAGQIRAQFKSLDIAGRAARASQIEVFTDGSLIPDSRHGNVTMGFAAIFVFHMAGTSPTYAAVSGATRDGPFSSTTSEILAILAVMALLPADTTATIWCDSQAAIAFTHRLQRQGDESWRKSSLAYIAQFYVLQLRQRPEPLKLMWIRSHTGNEGNEAADAAAKSAQRQQQGWWTLRLGVLSKQSS